MIPPGLVTKRRVLASAYIAAMAAMLSGAFAPAVRDMPWEPALAGAGILVLSLAGTAVVFFGLKSDSLWISVGRVGLGSVMVAVAALLILYFG